MVKKIGIALERSVTKRFEEGVAKISRAWLANRTRQKILQYISKYPCSHISAISKGVAKPQSTLKWHLKKLEIADYIAKTELTKGSCYFLKGVLTKQDVLILNTLRNDDAKKIFELLSVKPSISTTEIKKSTGFTHKKTRILLSNLYKTGIIQYIKDGNANRYFQTDLVRKRAKMCIKKSIKVREHLLEKMRNEGLKPKRVRSTNELLIVELTYSADKHTMYIFTNPYFATLAEKAF